MMKPVHAIAALLALSVCPLAGCAERGAAGPGPVGDNQALVWERFRDATYREPDTGVFIVEGDMPLVGEGELRDYFNRYVQKGALIVNRANGVDTVWDREQALDLTYCVSRSSFGDRHARVADALAGAARDWEAVAGVRFEHVTALDDRCGPHTSGVVFDVRQVENRPYLARAFSPHVHRWYRNILLDVAIYDRVDDPDSSATLRGYMRHELGHALGFRHEHTRPESGSCYEDDNWRPLTTYDAESVMHYTNARCNGTKTGDDVITARDAAGAAAVYPRLGGGCDGLDYRGRCSGDVAEWCQGGRLRSYDCAEDGRTCGYVDDAIGYYCVDRAPEPEPQPEPEPDWNQSGSPH